MDNRPTITSLPPEVLSVIIDFLSPRHRSDPWVHTDRVCKQWRLLSLAHGNTLDPSPLVFRARRAFSDIQQAFAQAFVLLAQDPLRVAALRKLAVKDWMWPHLSRMPHLLLNLHHLNVLSMEPHGIVSPRVAHLAEALQQNTTQLRLICFPDVCSFLLFASSFDSSEHLAGIAQKIEIEMPTVRDRKKDTSIEPAMAPYPCDLSFLAVAKALGGPFTTLHKLRLVTESDYISPMTCQESGQHGFFPNVESLSERNRASSLLPYMEKLISYRSVGIACPSIEAFTFNPSVSSTLTTIAMEFEIFPPSFNIHDFAKSLATLSKLEIFLFTVSNLQMSHLRLILKSLSCATGLEHLLLGSLRDGNDNATEEAFADKDGVVSSTWDLATSFPKLRTCEIRSLSRIQLGVSCCITGQKYGVD